MPMLNWQLCVCIIRWPQKTRPLHLPHGAVVRSSNDIPKTILHLTKKLFTSCVYNICLRSVIALIAATTTRLQGLLRLVLSYSFGFTVRRRRWTCASSTAPRYGVTKNSTPFNGLINATRKQCYYCYSALCTGDKREERMFTPKKEKQRGKSTDRKIK